MRLFVAHHIGPEATARLGAAVASIHGRLPRGAWVGSHAWHLTFAFLGEQSPDVVPGLVEALRRATAELSPIDASLRNGGFFPNSRRPRVGWIAVEPHEPVVALADAVRAAVSACGVRFDEKAFKAHMTLVRIRDEWRARDTELFVNAIEAVGAIPFTLGRVSLFESRLLGSGAVHTELAGFGLV